MCQIALGDWKGFHAINSKVGDFSSTQMPEIINRESQAEINEEQHIFSKSW